MSRSLTYLRQALFGAVLFGALGFGATQAVGSPADAAAVRACPIKGYDYAYAPCAQGCPSGRGYCSESGVCRCGDIP